ncbi:mediator of DNA damage checkpoint protein 1 [Spea bombifrons]|uniref:mediator of DNA damage checkpoint protein 1 n=1 Tax=Spea bombifrons TaxID=233779 RepID=UPI0023496625|nr:mediator of DNA damage checkpoint protein 1 [Spea bombifrons]
MDLTQRLPSDDDEDDLSTDRSRPAARLHMFSGTYGPAQDYDIYPGKNIIGRHAKCDITLPAQSVSKKHAILEVEGDLHTISDCGSLNKTRRGKVAITPHVRYSVADGDFLMFADVACRYTIVKEEKRKEEEEDDTAVQTESEDDSFLVPGTQATLAIEKTPGAAIRRIGRGAVLARDSGEEDEHEEEEEGQSSLSEGKGVGSSRDNYKVSAVGTFSSPFADTFVPESDEEGDASVSQSRLPSLNLRCDSDIDTPTKRESLALSSLSFSTSPTTMEKKIPSTSKAGTSNGPGSDASMSSAVKDKSPLGQKEQALIEAGEKETSDVRDPEGRGLGTDSSLDAAPVEEAAATSSVNPDSSKSIRDDTSDTSQPHRTKGEAAGMILKNANDVEDDDIISPSNKDMEKAESTGDVPDSDADIEDSAPTSTTDAKKTGEAFHVDSDTDIEDDVATTSAAGLQAGESVKQAGNVKTTAKEETEFHLNSDTDVEEEEAVSVSTGIKKRKAKITDSDTDVDEEEAISVNAGIKKREAIISDSDTDVEEEEVISVNAGIKKREAIVSDSDTDVEEEEVISVNAGIKKREAIVSDSDTDVEDEEAVSVNAGIKKRKARISDSDTDVDEEEAISVNAGVKKREAIISDSDTDVESDPNAGGEAKSKKIKAKPDSKTDAKGNNDRPLKTDAKKGSVPFNLDSDPDVEDEAGVSPAVKKSAENLGTHLVQTRTAKPSLDIQAGGMEDIRTARGNAEQNALPGFHVDSDTDVDEADDEPAESSTTGEKTGEGGGCDTEKIEIGEVIQTGGTALQREDLPAKADGTRSAAAGFHMDSDTDVDEDDSLTPEKSHGTEDDQSRVNNGDAVGAAGRSSDPEVKAVQRNEADPTPVSAEKIAEGTPKTDSEGGEYDACATQCYLEAEDTASDQPDEDNCAEEATQAFIFSSTWAEADLFKRPADPIGVLQISPVRISTSEEETDENVMAETQPYLCENAPSVVDCVQETVQTDSECAETSRETQPLSHGDVSQDDTQPVSQYLAARPTHETGTWLHLKREAPACGDSEGRGEGTAPEGVTRSAAPEDVTRSAAPEDVTRSAAPEGVTRSAAPEDVTRSAAPEGVTRSAAPEDVTRSAAPEGVTRSAAPEGVTRSAAPEGVTRSAAPEGVTRSAAPEDVTRSAAPEDVTQPYTLNMLHTDGETTQSYAEDTSALEEDVAAPFTLQVSCTEDSVNVPASSPDDSSRVAAAVMEGNNLQPDRLQEPTAEDSSLGVISEEASTASNVESKQTVSSEGQTGVLEVEEKEGIASSAEMGKTRETLEEPPASPLSGLIVQERGTLEKERCDSVTRRESVTVEKRRTRRIVNEESKIQETVKEADRGVSSRSKRRNRTDIDAELFTSGVRENVKKKRATRKSKVEKTEAETTEEERKDGVSPEHEELRTDILKDERLTSVTEKERCLAAGEQNEKSMEQPREKHIKYDKHITAQSLHTNSETQNHGAEGSAGISSVSEEAGTSFASETATIDEETSQLRGQNVELMAGGVEGNTEAETDTSDLRKKEEEEAVSGRTSGNRSYVKKTLTRRSQVKVPESGEQEKEEMMPPAVPVEEEVSVNRRSGRGKGRAARRNVGDQEQVLETVVPPGKLTSKRKAKKTEEELNEQEETIRKTEELPPPRRTRRNSKEEGSRERKEEKGKSEEPPPVSRRTRKNSMGEGTSEQKEGKTEEDPANKVISRRTRKNSREEEDKLKAEQETTDPTRRSRSAKRDAKDEEAGIEGETSRRNRRECKEVENVVPSRQKASRRTRRNSKEEEGKIEEKKTEPAIVQTAEEPEKEAAKQTSRRGKTNSREMKSQSSEAEQTPSKVTSKVRNPTSRTRRKKQAEDDEDLQEDEATEVENQPAVHEAETSSVAIGRSRRTKDVLPPPPSTPVPSRKRGQGPKDGGAEVKRKKSEETEQGNGGQEQPSPLSRGTRGRRVVAAVAEVDAEYGNDHGKGPSVPPPSPAGSGRQKPRAAVPAEVQTPRRTNRSSAAAGSSSPCVPHQGAVPKVLFTGVVDSAGEETILALGGGIAESVFDCTHLVTDRVRRTVKFLCALARGVPIVTLDWLEKCKKSGCFLSPAGFLVNDKEQEKNFGFVLSESLQKAKRRALFEGYEIHVTENVKPEPENMKDIIRCAGATFLPKMPRTCKEKCVIVSCQEDASRWKAAPSAAPVTSAEFILSGILRQEANPTAYLLNPGTKTPAPTPAKRRR